MAKKLKDNEVGTGALDVCNNQKFKGYPNPCITVITACLNSAATIEKSIKSVLSQTYKNIEYIIVDGGSNDGTLEIIRKYDEYLDCVISEKDNGVYDAMNKGINLAKGSILYFLNADDELYDETVFDIVINTFRRFPYVDVIYGNAKLIYPDGEEADAIYPKNLAWGHFRNRTLCHQSMFTKRSAFKKVGLYELEYTIAADYAWILKSIWVHGINYQHVDMFISKFYMGGKHADPINSMLLKEERQNAMKKYIPNIKAENTKIRLKTILSKLKRTLMK